MKTITRSLLTSSLFIGLLIGGAAPARPQSLPPGCSITIEGRDATTATTPGTAIPIPAGQDAALRIESTTAIATHSVALDLLGLRVTLHSTTDGHPALNDIVEVQKFGGLGVGLYKVHIEAYQPDRCAVSAFIDVDGAPLGEPAGWLALLLLGLGVLMMALRTPASKRQRREVRNIEWAGEGAAETPRAYALSIAGGVVAALGGLLLAQEFSVAYPTLIVFAIAVAAGVGVGLVVPPASRAIYSRVVSR